METKLYGKINARKMRPFKITDVSLSTESIDKNEIQNTVSVDQETLQQTPTNIKDLVVKVNGNTEDGFPIDTHRRNLQTMTALR